MSRAITKDIFLERFSNSPESNEYKILNLDEYQNLKSYLKFYHKVCNHTSIMMAKYFINNGSRCHNCAQLKRNSSNKRELNMKEINAFRENKLKLINVKNKNGNAEFECTLCGYHFISGFVKQQSHNKLSGCPFCSVPDSSMSEKRINNVIKKVNESNLNIDIIPNKFNGVLKPSTFICKDTNEIFIGYLNNMLLKGECLHCATNNRKNLEDYIKELPNDYEIIDKESYKDSHSIMKFRHKTCNSVFSKSISDFFYNSQYCKKCSKFKNYKNSMMSNEELIDRLSKSGYKDISIEKYYGRNSLCKVKCATCETIYEDTAYRLYNTLYCKKCNQSGSNGERLIRKYLINKGIHFEEQKKFDDLIYKGYLRFDFYVPTDNILIEFDGIQHFKPIDLFGGEDTFRESKIRDSLKNEYCRNKGYTLIRIPYTDIDNIEKYLIF